MDSPFITRAEYLANAERYERWAERHERLVENFRKLAAEARARGAGQL